MKTRTEMLVMGLAGFRCMASGVVPNLSAVESITDTSPLHFAVWNNDIATVEQLFYQDSSLEMNAVNYYGATPLYLAGIRQNIKMIQLLLNFGADIQSLDEAIDATPLRCKEHLDQSQFLQNARYIKKEWPAFYREAQENLDIVVLNEGALFFGVSDVSKKRKDDCIINSILSKIMASLSARSTCNFIEGDNQRDVLKRLCHYWIAKLSLGITHRSELVLGASSILATPTLQK